MAKEIKEPKNLEKRAAKAASALVIITMATYGLHSFLLSQAIKGAKTVVYDALTLVVMSLLLYVIFE